MDRDRDAVRKKEDCFHSDFAQIAATELARLGAPAMITWQKLIFDKDCCAQAFRLLLTKIKSSRRISASTASSSRRTLSSGLKQQPQIEESGDYTEDRFEPDDDHAETESPIPRQRVSFKTKLRSTVRKSTPARSEDGGGWNFDISTSSSERQPDNNNDEAPDELHRERIGLPSLNSGVNSIIERRVGNIKQHTSTTQAAKTKTDQLQNLRRENTALSEENARLKEEITHLEEVNALLQNDSSRPDPLATFDYRRMKLVQAQSMQLQRQVKLLQDAIIDNQQVESNLLVALNRLRDVVEAGVQEAKIAGADQNGRSESGKDVKWMMAVPEALLSELNRIEAQVHSASTAISGTFASKLRVSGASSSFLRSSTVHLRTADVFGAGLQQHFGHLRLNRVKVLEEKLVRVAKALDVFTREVLHERPPRIQLDNNQREDEPDAAALCDATREVVLELGALGTVISIAQSHPVVKSQVGDLEDSITAMQVYKMFASASNNKEREKNLKLMMKQLHARHLSMGNEMSACRREMQYWRSAWQKQEEIVSLLAKRVLHLGQKKMEWYQVNMSEPLKQISQVFECFQHAQQEGSLRQNPYLPLLIETLECQQSLLMDGLSQWRSYSSSMESRLNQLFEDYEANREVLLRQQ